MASSAFKSTTRRSLHGSSASRSDQPPCPRRSRSVSAAPRGRDLQEDYANTRTNPLFDSTASPQQRSAGTATSTSSGGGGDVARRERDRGREPVKGGGRGAGGRARSVSVAPQRRRTDSAPSADSVGGRRSSRARSVTDDARPYRGSDPIKGGGRGGGGGRARSVSVAPQRRRTDSAPSADSAAAVGGRRSSRARSVANDARSYRGSETDAESRDMTRKFQSRRSRDSVLENKHRLNVMSASCSSKGSTAGVKCQQMDETARSLSSASVSSPGDHLEHVIWRPNHSTVPADPVLEIPPEFDPDSAEFISDISDYASEYRKEEVVDISLDVDTDAAELAVDITHDAANHDLGQMKIPHEFDPDAVEELSELRQYSRKQQWEQIEIPLEFDPETSELTTDITEYTIKLKQSHERARKLRADLAVEEQREQELSRMLKGIVTVPNFTETHKKRPRRKSSIERLKVSRHLAEEAMNYFEECVSISTMDSTDFSSPEDPQSNSLVSLLPKNNSRFSHNGGSSFQEPRPTTDQHGLREESENQTQCSISINGSDTSDNVFFSHVNPSGLKIRSNSSDDIDGFDTPRSRSSCFSFTREPAKTVQKCDVQHYIGNFGRGDNKALRGMRSSYSADDYALQKENLDLLTDIMTFQNRIEYGGLLICSTRTF